MYRWLWGRAPQPDPAGGDGPRTGDVGVTVTGSTHAVETLRAALNRALG
jgi:hypothetical protein